MSTTEREALEAELANCVLLPGGQPAAKSHTDAVKAALAALPDPVEDVEVAAVPVVESATVEAPENAARSKAQPRAKAKAR